MSRYLVCFSEGSSKSESSRLFKVSLWCIKDCCKRSELAAKPHPKRVRRIDMTKLSRHIQDNSDAILRELASEFDITEQAIWYALRRLKVSHNNAL